MSTKPDSDRAGGGRRMFFTPMPNALFFVGAFPDLTAQQVLSLQRHVHLAKKQVKYLEMAFGPTYDARSKFIARYPTTATRNNRVRIAQGYVELVRQNRGKPPTFRLTPKLKEKLLRTTTEIRADRDNKPRKRRIPDGLLKWQKRSKVETGSFNRKRGHDAAANNGGNARVETGSFGSVETASFGSSRSCVFQQKRDAPKRDSKKIKDKSATVRGCAPDTPQPAREAVQEALDRFRSNGSSESNIRTVLEYVVHTCLEATGRKPRAVPPFVYEDICSAIKKSDALGLDFFQVTDRCAEVAKTNTENLATVSDFFSPVLRAEI